MKPIIDEFEKENPDIKIDFSYSPPVGEYIQTLQTRLVGNQAPDVFIITTENKSNLIDNGYVMDLTDEPFMKNVAKANKDFLSKDGKAYGLSTSSWESTIVYNKYLLKKVGADGIPATWDEFLNLIKKLKDAGVDPYQEAIDDMPKNFMAFLGAKYDLAGNTEGEKAIFDGSSSFEKEWMPELTQWYRLWSEGLLSRDAAGMSGDDVKTEFMNGQLAMYTTGPWDFADLQKSGIDFGCGFTPSLEGGEQYGSGSPSPGLAIYSKLTGKKLDAAKKFLEFYISEKSLQAQSDNGDAITATNFTSSVIPQFQDIYDKGMRDSKYYLSMNYWDSPDALQQEGKAEMQLLVQGKITPLQAAQAMDKKAQSLQ
jgi:raffinose/stachyose/melibiose transport system substrate-binding protein